MLHKDHRCAASEALQRNPKYAAPPWPASEDCSDRGSRFITKFWQAFQRCIGSNLTMSPAYHLHTDGTCQAYPNADVQVLVDKQLSNWDEMRLCCKSVYNNKKQVLTKCASFYVDYGMLPLTLAGLIVVLRQPRCMVHVPDSAARLTAMRTVQSDAKAALRRQSQYRRALRANLGRM